MAEREDWLVSKMTRTEVRELSDVDKKERTRLKRSITDKKRYQENREERLKHQKKYHQENREEILTKQKKYREEHKEEKNEYNRQYYEENKEELKEYKREYNQTPAGKKVNRISVWTNKLGLQESKEDLDRIYELYLHQELCNACDCVLTRSGKLISTDASMDHDHDTHRFRHIICRKCNTNDNWKKYFC